ncbi:hypothetical protein CAPTEDRAFT_207162 [Capitella teleta]|uniref:Uncharacterized protein n=1 Tax=Capitella teleta TaxID=283909 RepID=R7V9T4_CAPTE|nr:hypothetical protein CAPTEDRAFT_207162 [Capitella teleta]|eukprot:ELU15598.1 hypothetical protein CAPTEDRAFT_207162 [Capitella teleta]
MAAQEKLQKKANAICTELVWAESHLVGCAFADCVCPADVFGFGCRFVLVSVAVKEEDWIATTVQHVCSTEGGSCEIDDEFGEVCEPDVDFEEKEFPEKGNVAFRIKGDGSFYNDTGKFGMCSVCVLKCIYLRPLLRIHWT